MKAKRKLTFQQSFFCEQSNVPGYYSDFAFRSLDLKKYVELNKNFIIDHFHNKHSYTYMR